MTIQKEFKAILTNLSTMNPSILDLGFGSAADYFCLFKQFMSNGTNRFYFTGVEICDEWNVFFQNCSNDIQTPGFKITTEDWVKKFNNTPYNSHLDDEDLVIEAESFIKYFRFYFETDIVNFVTNSENIKKYNIILLINILHKLSHSDAELVFRKCLSLMDEQSIIFISVLGEKYSRALDEDKLYDYQRYLSMKERLQILWDNDDVLSNFQFVGKLK